MLDLEDIFGPGGPLHSALPDFKSRWQQLRMAERVATALEHRETVVVEAGTGTGKTFAYLVPALLCGSRVLISTGTRTLQDQLFSKDLPLVAAALGRPARIALLKGRTNYLCRYRLAHAGPVGEQLSLVASATETTTSNTHDSADSAVSADGLDSAESPDSADSDATAKAKASGAFAAATAKAATAPASVAPDTDPEPTTHLSMLARIQRWSRTTRQGDLSEVRGLSDSHPVWPQVTSTRDNCLGNRCPEISRCHVAVARRDALDADIVIVNHHLLLADLALKEDGFGDILGTADAVILDEAHQIPDLATQFFGANVGSRRIENLLKDAQNEITAELACVSAESQAASVIAAISAAAGAVDQSKLRLASSLPSRVGRYSLSEMGAQVTTSVNELSHSLQALQTSLADLGDDSPLAQLGERVGDLVLSLDRIAATDELEGVRAVEVTQRGFSLSLMPFDISARFLSMIQARHCGWIFTSATLSLGEDFGHFTGRLGLTDSPTLKIESPFNYELQSLLYLPTGMPEPASSGYVAKVIETALPLIDAARGGAFVLFTSHRALAQGASLLRACWSGHSPYRLFVQGEAPRERLLKEFREDGNGVLLGTTSFWEGVDVKGEALRLVVIEKLPFASPDDPLVRARIDHLQATGGNAFRDYQLPEAALALKQGVGRLIRSEEDYGTVVICDPRMMGRGYGKVLLAALPAMTPTRDRDEALRFIRKHAPPPKPVSDQATARTAAAP
ncbi:MAG TPA: ATP-dependent DNA helicase [Steroidobacteraceae bacterium]|nr:ATP-dependent DNA helicase [Steroidobacteraceae bacterium]